MQAGGTGCGRRGTWAVAPCALLLSREPGSHCDRLSKAPAGQADLVLTADRVAFPIARPMASETSVRLSSEFPGGGNTCSALQLGLLGDQPRMQLPVSVCSLLAMHVRKLRLPVQACGHHTRPHWALACCYGAVAQPQFPQDLIVPGLQEPNLCPLINCPPTRPVLLVPYQLP
ncbi:hypothetical protein GW7_18972 [Heterocephalus glaber]|uniref:Uncharacterized protein n=1 Tax=Heterocephalus glaber TaxID=10181 RepID=G5BCK4_HETGA|nr:hypothetical protein GW7_18972 [Heterocephalus glaber]